MSYILAEKLKAGRAGKKNLTNERNDRGGNQSKLGAKTERKTGALIRTEIWKPLNIDNKVSVQLINQNH